MKKIIALLIISGFALSSKADPGPFYISYANYCNVQEIYLTNQGDFHGKEIGCSANLGAPVFGMIDGVSLNGYSSSSAGGRTCIYLYRNDNQLRGGCSDGNQYVYKTPTYYRLTSYNPRSAAKAAPGQSELPSIYD